tara:strand:- start:42 stop:254 length:213 start_codon:yes stop_codon:yes gene_type:complete
MSVLYPISRHSGFAQMGIACLYFSFSAASSNKNDNILWQIYLVQEELPKKFIHESAVCLICVFDVINAES